MNEGMVGFHTHILPGMDDGAKDEKESKKMLEALSRQDVHMVCLILHFYPFGKLKGMNLSQMKTRIYEWSASRAKNHCGDLYQSTLK